MRHLPTEWSDVQNLASFKSEIDLGLVMGEDGKMENNAIFLRTRLYFYNTDISLMAMDFKNNLMLTFDMTRSISEAVRVSQKGPQRLPLEKLF